MLISGPYDVLFLEAKRHQRLLCMDKRRELDLVVNSSSLERSSGQECIVDYMSNLKSHSFDTLSESSQRILAHSLKRAMCIEVPTILASEFIGYAFGGNPDQPEEQNRIQKFITSQNGIKAIKALMRTSCNLVSMGVEPTAASFALQTGVCIAENTFNLIANKTGLAETEVAKKFQETAEYISSYVPEVIRENLFGFLMIYALNNIQYANYVDGYAHNWSVFDNDYKKGGLESARFVPHSSITAAESVITSCIVALVATAITAGLKYILKRTANPAQIGDEAVSDAASDYELVEITTSSHTLGNLFSSDEAKISVLDDDCDIEMGKRKSDDSLNINEIEISISGHEENKVSPSSSPAETKSSENLASLRTNGSKPIVI